MDRRMTKAERDDLVRLIRSRERIAKSAAQQRSAQMLVEFERQVSAAHAFDSNEVWNAAMEAGDRAVQEAMDKIEAESARLGIPEEFRPKLACYWQSRGSNAFSERRTELRRLAQAEIAAIEKAAFVQIEAQSVAAQTRIIADGLDSEAAIAFLNELPPVEQLMPPLDLNVIQATIADRARRGGRQEGAGMDGAARRWQCVNTTGWLTEAGVRIDAPAIGEVCTLREARRAVNWQTGREGLFLAFVEAPGILYPRECFRPLGEAEREFEALRRLAAEPRPARVGAPA